MASAWRRLQWRTTWLSVGQFFARSRPSVNDYNLLPVSVGQRHAMKGNTCECNPLYVLVVLLVVLGFGVVVARPLESSPGSK